MEETLLYPCELPGYLSPGGVQATEVLDETLVPLIHLFRIKFIHICHNTVPHLVLFIDCSQKRQRARVQLSNRCFAFVEQDSNLSKTETIAQAQLKDLLLQGR